MWVEIVQLYDLIEHRVEHSVHDTEVFVKRGSVVLQVYSRCKCEIEFLQEDNKRRAQFQGKVGPPMAHLHKAKCVTKTYIIAMEHWKSSTRQQLYWN